MRPLHRFVTTLALCGCTGAACAAYSGLYVIGDSLSDTGNVALAVGADAGQSITDNGYIPTRPYASGTFSNGPVWVDSFAAAIGLPSFAAPSLAGGGVFAFGGARVDLDGPGQPPSLTAQTGLLLSALGGSLPNNALYVVAGGGNDARDALAAAALSGDPAGTIASAALAYAQDTGAIVDALQAAGAQRIVVWDAPDLGGAPAVRAQGPAAIGLGTLVSTGLNGALAARLQGEAGVTLFDLFGWQHSFAANAAAYGLTNVTDACGAAPACTPSSWLYWDGIHPTARGHQLLAQAMFATAVPEPDTLSLWAAGAALLMGLTGGGKVWARVSIAPRLMRRARHLQEPSCRTRFPSTTTRFPRTARRH